jgi:hypothetical protein
MNHRSPQDSEGFQEFRKLQGKTSLRDYPWKTIATNVGGIAAGAGAGYLAGGILTHAAMQAGLGRRLSQMSPAQRRALWAGIGGVATATGLTARGLASVVGQARLAEELARKHEEASEKTASYEEVVRTYRLALEMG